MHPDQLKLGSCLGYHEGILTVHSGIKGGYTFVHQNTMRIAPLMAANLQQRQRITQPTNLILTLIDMTIGYE